jgi:hypothetical protein
MLAVGLWLVAGQAVVRAVVVGHGYFWQDDYVQLAQARRLGLSARFLFQDYNGHLQPGQYLLIWLTSRGTGLHYGVAGTTMVALQVLASVALLWALRQLFGTSFLLLIPFTAYLFTPLLLVAGTWWSASLQAFPLQIAMLSCIGAAARYFRSGDWRWMACSWAAFALGLCFWEKAVLILPALLGVNLLILERQAPLRARWQGLRTRAWFWVGHLVILGGYLITYLSVVGTGGQLSGTTDVSTVFDRLIVQTFVTGIFGGPWTGRGVENTITADPNLITVVLTSAALVGLVVLSVLLRGRAAVSAWALLVGYLVLDVVLLAELRTGFSTFLARDPRYITDALPVATICVAAAFLPRHPAKSPALDRQTLPQRIEAGTTTSTGAVFIVALAFSALITTTQVSYALRHGYSKAYATTALNSARQDPALHLVDAAAPPIEVVAKPISTIFAAAGVPVSVDQPSTQLKILDGFGRPQLVDFLAPTLVARGPKKDCGWVVGRGGLDIATIPAPSPGGSVLRIGYLASAAWTMDITVGGEPMSLAVPKGLGVAYFPIGHRTGRLTVQVGSTGKGVCVSDVTAGAPWPGQ